MIKLKKILILALAMMVASCSTTPPSSSSSQHAHQAESAHYYLQQAAASDYAHRPKYYIKAADSLVETGKFDYAQKLLDSIDSQLLESEQLYERQIVFAKLALAKKQLRHAMDLLASNKLSYTDNTRLKQRRHKLLAEAYQLQNQPLQSAQQLMLLDQLLSHPAEKLENQRLLLSTLQQVPKTILQQTSQTITTPPIWRGWLELALINREPPSKLAALQTAIEQWQISYPQHPAHLLLTPTHSEPRPARELQPLHVALLLPLSGKLAPAGQSIRNGFLTSYYQSPIESRPALSIYDTNTQEDIKTIYQQAVTQGATLVIGPLDKNKVDALARLHSLSVPVLALNYPQRPAASPQLFQFALAPQDEINQLAEQASEKGYQSAVVIGSDSTWGQNNIELLKRAWQEQGKEIKETTFIPATHEAKPMIEHLLRIDESKQRATQIQDAIGERIQHTPRRRTDIDVIFLFSSGPLARQIKPLLNFYFAADIPVYSLAEVYPGTPNIRRDRDISGIFFYDIPWIANPTPNMVKTRQLITKLWPKSFHVYPRLYAFGYDSFTLSQQLSRLQAYPELGIFGATGVLYLDEQQKIHRRLTLSQIYNGRLRTS